MDIWTVEIAINFVDVVDDTIERIFQHPKQFKVSQYDIKSREALIIKHTTMFYRIVENTVEIEYFWWNFDGPEKIRGFLKTG